MNNSHETKGHFDWPNRGEWMQAPPTRAMGCRYSPQKVPVEWKKVTPRMNGPMRNSTQLRNEIYLIDNTIMWSPSLFFISNRFYRTQNNFSPLNDHIIVEFRVSCDLFTDLTTGEATVRTFLPR